MKTGEEVYGEISESGFGAFAESVSFDKEAVAPKPPEMTFETAASRPHAARLVEAAGGGARKLLADVRQAA